MTTRMRAAARTLLVIVTAVATVAVDAVAMGAAAHAAGTPVVEKAPHDVLVHWGTHVDTNQAAAVAGLLAGFDHSGYMHGLATTYGLSDSVGYDGGGVIPDSAASSQVDPSTIASTVAAGIANGTLPAITGDANYIVMLPPGDALPSDSQTQQPPCAVHQPFTAGSQTAHLIVLADYSTTARQCGAAGTDVASAATVQLSRELVDTLTDPAADGSGILASPAAVELGEACVGGNPIGNVDGWVVQPWWDNSAGGCSLGTIGVALTGDVDAVTNSQQATFLLHDTESGARQASFSCTVDGASTGCGTSAPLAVTGLAAGSHTVGVQASGVGSASFSWLVDLSPPVAALTGSLAAITVAKTVTVNFSGSDSGGAGVAAYDVRYRLAAWNGGFGHWIQPPAWQATTHTSVRMTVAAGRTYCFSVRAQDAAGNVQPSWSDPRCTTTPVDDRSLPGTRGWTRLRARAAYRGTLTRGAVPGARLRLVHAHGDRIALLVRTCPACGRIALYRSGVLWRTVSTRRATARNQVLLVQPRFSLRTTTIWVQVVGKRPVYLDGVAVQSL